MAEDGPPQVVIDDDPNDTPSDFLPVWFVYGVFIVMMLAVLAGIALARFLYG